MKLAIRRSLVAAVLLLAARGSFAAVGVPVSVEDLARGSDAVVRGKVTGVSARWEGTRIYTFTEVDVTSVWRGSAPARIRVATPGGVVGRIGQRVDGAAVFAPAEEVVVFLAKGDGGAFRVNGLAQGKFAVRDGTASPDLAHTTFLAKEIATGERRSEEMSVEELERRVRSIR
jgi:hypothetical protein